MGSPARSRHLSRRLAHVAAVSGLVGLGLVAQRDLLRNAASTVYAQSIPGSDSLLHVWTLAWGQHALATAPARVFDANIFHPHPDALLYSDHLLGLAVPLAPLRLVTDDPVLVHNVILLAAPILDALAMYALALDLTGHLGGALVAAVVYGFAPLRLGIDRTQLQMLAAWWLPLVFLWARRALAHGRWRDAGLAGMALAAQALTGIYLTVFLLPFLALAHLWWLRRFPLPTHARAWRRLLAAETVAALVALPSALAYHRVQVELGITRSPVMNALLAQPSLLVNFLPVVTVGILLVVLAVRWRHVPPGARAEAPLLGAIAAGALVLALGPALPLPAAHGWVKGPYAALVSLPGFSALRAPARMMHVALVALGPLAAAAVAAAAAGQRRGVAAMIVAASVCAAVVEGGLPNFQLDTVPRPEDDPVYRWLARQ